MRTFIALIVLASHASASGICPTCAVTKYGIQLNPGEYLVSVEGVPVGEPAPVNEVPMSQPVSAPPMTQMAPRSGSSALSAINQMRMRRGLRPFQFDPQLQAVAQARASRMAANGRKGHVRGSFSPGRAEGVAWHSARANPERCCYTTSSRFTAAGSASVRGRDGVYTATVYR